MSPFVGCTGLCSTGGWSSFRNMKHFKSSFGTSSRHSSGSAFGQLTSNVCGPYKCNYFPFFPPPIFSLLQPFLIEGVQKLTEFGDSLVIAFLSNRKSLCPSCLCMKMSSFMYERACAMPHTLYLSCGILFPVWTPDNISGLTSFLVWLSR